MRMGCLRFSIGFNSANGAGGPHAEEDLCMREQAGSDAQVEGVAHIRALLQLLCRPKGVT